MDGINLTFEFRDEDLEVPLRFTFEVGMVLIITYA